MTPQPPPTATTLRRTRANASSPISSPLRTSGLRPPVSSLLLLAALLLLPSCSAPQRAGIARLMDVGYDVADGQPDYYGPCTLDTDGDGVPNEVDRHPMDPNSIYFLNDNRQEDTPHE